LSPAEVEVALVRIRQLFATSDYEYSRRSLGTPPEGAIPSFRYFASNPSQNSSRHPRAADTLHFVLNRIKAFLNVSGTGSIPGRGGSTSANNLPVI
jgi:hypothetical protein